MQKGLQSKAIPVEVAKESKNQTHTYNSTTSQPSQDPV